MGGESASGRGDPEMTEDATALKVLWDWGYDIDQTRLEDLYVRAKEAQWNADVAVDWSRPVDPAGRILDQDRMAILRMRFFDRLSEAQRADFNAHYSAWILSQLLHGEQGALMVAGQLVSAVPDYEAKLYVASQAMDEARHVEVFSRYIRKLDRIYPVQPILASILDSIMHADHWQSRMVGMQVILEGLALGAFINVRAATACELLAEMLTYVTKDEARHVAFGNIYLSESVRDMHPDDHAAVEDFALDVTRKVVAMRRGREGFEGFDQVLTDTGIDPADFLKAMHEEIAAGLQLNSSPGSVHPFRGLVMPGIARAGLVTDRVKPLYDQADIRVFTDTHLLEQFEATGTMSA